MTKVFNWFLLLVIGYVLGQGGINTIVHEMGHYITIKALYEDCPITVEIEAPFKAQMGPLPTTHGMTTHPYKYNCAPREGLLSDKYALPITGYGGGMGTVAFSCLEIALAAALKRRFPLLAQFLLAQAITGIAMETIYAAFLTGGDYAINTYLTGIPRWLPTSMILGIPLLVWWKLNHVEEEELQIA